MHNHHLLFTLYFFQPGKRKSQSAVVRTKASAKKKSGRKSAKSAKSRAKSAPGAIEASEIKRDPDILDPIAMEHLYYTAHNVVTALELRGFRWEAAPKKKGKKGKKRK